MAEFFDDKKQSKLLAKLLDNKRFNRRRYVYRNKSIPLSLNQQGASKSMFLSPNAAILVTYYGGDTYRHEVINGKICDAALAISLTKGADNDATWEFLNCSDEEIGIIEKAVAFRQRKMDEYFRLVNERLGR